MSRLIASEVRRVLARRMVRRTIMLLALALVAAGVIAFARSGSMSAAVYHQKFERVQALDRQQLAAGRSCLAAHGVRVGDGYSDSVYNACFPKGQASLHDPRFHRSRLLDLLHGSSGILALLGWAVGASLVGAEFTSRGVTSTLTWETRRGRVFGAKLVAAALAVAALSAAAMVALTLVMQPSLIWHGAPVTASDPSWGAVAGLIGRGIGLATLMAAMGFGLATLTRSTAASLGIGFGYIVVIENILGDALRGWRRWLLLGNIIVLVTGKGSSDIPGRSVLGAAGFLLAVAAAALAIGLAAFKGRDIA